MKPLPTSWKRSDVNNTESSYSSTMLISLRRHSVSSTTSTRPYSTSSSSTSWKTRKCRRLKPMRYLGYSNRETWTLTARSYPRLRRNSQQTGGSRRRSNYNLISKSDHFILYIMAEQVTTTMSSSPETQENPIQERKAPMKPNFKLQLDKINQ